MRFRPEAAGESGQGWRERVQKDPCRTLFRHNLRLPHGAALHVNGGNHQHLASGQETSASMAHSLMQDARKDISCDRDTGDRRSLRRLPVSSGCKTDPFGFDFSVQGYTTLFDLRGKQRQSTGRA